MGSVIGRVLPPVIVGLIAFAAARAAMLPGLGFWDTGELQVVAPVLGTGHATGFPVYTMLGWLASVLFQPFGDPAFRMNLFAGICLAVAAGVTVDLGRALSGRLVMGVAAGLGLTFTISAWAIGTHAETHALHLALLAILLRLLVAWEDTRSDRVLIAFAVAFGISAGNHSLTLLLIPAFGVFILAVEPGILRRTRLVATCLVALAITLVLVLAELPLRAGIFRAPLVYGRPDTWDGFWYIVFASQFQQDISAPVVEAGSKVSNLIDRIATQFGVLALALPFGVLATIVRRPNYALLSGIAVVITVGFSMNYNNGDISRYYLGPILFAWTWLAILGAAITDAVLGVLSSRRPPVAAPTGRSTARAAVSIAVAAALLLPTALSLPARFRVVDRSDDRSAQQWVDRTLDRLLPGAVVVSWWSYSTPLWYAQHIDGRRPDITILDDRTRLDEELGDITDVIDANLSSRPVYVIRADPREVELLEDRYLLEHLDGPDARTLTRVIARREGDA